MKKFLERLFGQKSPDSTEVPTKPLSQIEQDSLSMIGESKLDPPQLIVGLAQSVGMTRDHNEDSFFSLSTNLSSDQNHLPFGLFIVADGMGGHQHGEVASGLAVRSLASHVVRKLLIPLIGLAPKQPEESLQEIMQEGVQVAHRAIRKAVVGGGTTLTGVLILGEQMVLAHVGDSRAYILQNNGDISPLTRDHSLVKRLVELGQITNEEAAIHPQRNVLYRALGQGEPFDSDITAMHLPNEGYLLICSDGLWNMVAEDNLRQIIFDNPNPEIACQKLVAAANQAGGPDNITAILVRLPENEHGG